MIELKIKKDQVERAKKLYKFNTLKGSITKGKSNLFGAIGEILFIDFFNNNNISSNSTFDYDLIIKGYKIDVKTKRTTVKPKDEYLCSISSFNIKQECDFYFFCRIKEDLQTGYLLGYKEKRSFFTESFFVKKGDKDVNGFLFKDDCFNIKIKNLNKFKE